MILRRTVYIAVALVFIGSLSSCNSYQKQAQQQQTRLQQATDAHNAAVLQCKNDFYAGILKSHVDMAKCENVASETYLRPLMPVTWADVTNVAEASRIVLAEKVDKGVLTEAEADLQQKQAISQLITEAQARDNAALVAQAQARPLAPPAYASNDMSQQLRDMQFQQDWQAMQQQQQQWQQQGQQMQQQQQQWMQQQPRY